MARGQPDFGMYGATQTIGGMSDMGELAARLGSPVTFDRRGNVIWFDNFEGGIEAWAPGGNAGYSVTWNAQHHHSGGFACKLVTDDDDGDMASITTHLAIPVFSRLGFEVAITKQANTKQIELWSDIFTPDNIYYVRVKWVAADETWYYYNSAGAYAALTPTQKIYSSDYLFNHIKLVADPTAETYVRLIANNVAYDLSALALRKIAAGAVIGLVAAVLVYTNTDAAATAWVDNAIITQNEP